MLESNYITIKVTNPFDSGASLLKQTPHGSGVWGNYRFFINDEVDECDYWIVLDDLSQKELVKVPAGNTILFALECPSIKTYSTRFVEQFSLVVSCQQNIQHKNLVHHLTPTFWFVNKSYDELSSINPFTKDKLISIITSNKLFTDGHKRRYEFAHALKDFFGKDIDLFGRGINDFNDKWDVLAPYKYSVAIENSYYPYWLTEKMCDCFLAYSYPFYYGCPNAEKYFDNESFTRIDINNLEKSKRIIENILNNDRFYHEHINKLKLNKLKCLNQYNFFQVATQVIENNISPQSSSALSKLNKKKLEPTNNFEDKFISKVKSRIKYFFP